MSPGRVIFVGNSHTAQTDPEVSWPELIRRRLVEIGSSVVYINNAQPGHTMAGPAGSLAEVQAEVLDFLDPAAEFTIVFNGQGANDFYGAFQRTAEQHRVNCNLWADAIHAVDPEARLLLCGVFQYGGSTAEERAEVDAWNAMIADLDNFATNFPRYLPYPLLVGTIIPEAATTHPPFEVDNTHLDDSGELRVYDGAFGAEGARKIFWRAGLTGLIDMGNISTPALTALANHWRNKQPYAPAATHYAHAYVAGVVKSDTPASFDNDGTSYDAPAGRAVALAIVPDFAAPTTDWGAVDEIRITDNATPGAGLEIGRHTLDTPITIGVTLGAGGEPTGPLRVTGITITAPAGGLSDDEIHDLLGLMCGAVANTPRTSTWGVYGTNATTEVGSRVEMVQDDTHGDAVNGRCTNILPIAIADQVTATHWLEYDAAAAGNIIAATALPAVPSGGVIPAGALRTRLT